MLVQQHATVNAVCCNALHPAVACMCMPGQKRTATSWQLSSCRGTPITHRSYCINGYNILTQLQQKHLSPGAVSVCAVTPSAADSSEAAAFMRSFDQQKLSSIYAALTDRYQQDISVFAKLIQELECLVQQGKQLPGTYLNRLCSYLRPLPDGAFLFEFLDLLLCFHAMEYTPQTTWLQQLDDAVLDCCTDHSCANAPFMLSSQHAVAFMSLLCEDAERGLAACKGQRAAGIPVQACCVMAFPLLLESRMQGRQQQHRGHQASLGSAKVELGRQLDRYYTAVLAWYQMEGAASGRNWWPVQHSLHSLLTARACVPLLTRLQPAIQHMDASLDVLQDCIMFHQQNSGLSTNDALPAFEELQECMCAAMHLASRQAAAAAKKLQDSLDTSVTNKEYWGDVLQHVKELCTIVVRSYLPTAAAHSHAFSDVLQGLLALMHSIQLLDDAIRADSPWDMSDIVALDGYAADQTDPEVLVPALVLMAHHPGCWAPGAPDLRTPAKLLGLLGSERLPVFSYQHLVSILQMLGRINKQALAGTQEHGQEQPVHGVAAELQRLLQQQHWVCPSDCIVRPHATQVSGLMLVKMDLLSLLGSRLAYLLERMTPDEQEFALSWMK